MRYPHIDPVFFEIGPLQLRWYGLMYIIGFVCAYFLLTNLSKRESYDMDRIDIEDLLAYGVIGLIVGARLGYCLFYNFGFYFSHPLKCLAIWEGGMSFHGGLIGLVLGGWLFSRRKNKSLLMLADMGALAATPGLFFGRIGNFINAELYGRVTDVPWGMVFPGAGDLPRHPSQLYEAFFEGIVLFVVLFAMSRKVRTRGVLISTFLAGYGLMRFMLEFFREPDAQLGFIIGPLTMGQILSLLMVGAGVILLMKAIKVGQDFQR
ncbi:MAG TPA: prolipoprotein diacylglyceryl transferase [Deltaproteobacteria bacterium]|jgi:phosphatidylglycerol:prolipoprotein diacylglycerol transferase|nr:prolipoprotein diacylglyceryl transferase [Bacteriovoracaceae bacterium]HNU73663.1 prolipoprotein diacylglyceryl transferase [Deltaproteobacteria bacterium]HOD70682.1 prolipoprotein diacylglyceryl transferase [Deltaproteobacteria bacterium]HOE73407.1 prolipoprotein diacylglyceryl transferase [Deltaproteobacteria bacterium]HON60996.1 prolipoprotein diacylglyceryl transferase [Deltaproteobacteria bacterium]